MNTFDERNRWRSPRFYTSADPKEARALSFLQESRALSSPADTAFKRIADTLRQLFHVRYSWVFVVPTEADGTFDDSALPLFCRHLLHTKQPLVWTNETDQRDAFDRDDTVRRLGLRFFAGTPLLDGGRVVGTLAITDTQQKPFPHAQRLLLDNLGQWAVAEWKLEQHLVQSSWFKNAIENSSSGILITDPSLTDNPIVYANPTFSSLTGYSLDEIIGKNCRFLQGEGTDPTAVKHIRRAIRNQEDICVELLNYKKDGTPFWNELRINPVFDTRGNVTHFVGIQTDVTHRKRTEKAQAKAFFEQENLIQSIPEILYMVNREGKLIHWNNKMNRCSGFDDRELYLKDMAKLFDPIDQDGFIEKLQTLDHKPYVEFEAKLKKKKGQSKPFFWSLVSVIDENNDTIGYAGIGKDMAEQKKTEKDVMSAGVIQKKMLSRGLYHRRVSVTPIYVPNRYVSGDLYDIHWNEARQTLHLYLADIMGHGVTTVLQFSALKVLFGQQFEKEIPLREKMRRIHESSLPLFPDEHHFSAFYAEADLRRRTFRYVAAGIHTFLTLHKRRARLHKTPGMMMGMMPNVDFEEHELSFRAGEEMILGTDGFFDQIKSAQLFMESFEKEKLDYVAKLAHEGSRRDDATVLHIRFR